VLLALAGSLVAAARFAPEDAAKHAGRTATICDVVAPARSLERSTKQPTFLNPGKPDPDQSFSVVSFGSDCARSGTPEIAFMSVCKTGVISQFQGRAEMKLQDPSQFSPP
jgi:hypothetical protein